MTSKAVQAAQPRRVADVLSIVASATELDDEYLFARSRDKSRIERVGGPRAVSERYVDALDATAKFLQENQVDEEDYSRLRKSAGRMRAVSFLATLGASLCDSNIFSPHRNQRIVQLEKDQEKWKAMEWQILPINYKPWVLMLGVFVLLIFLLYLEEKHAMTPFGKPLFASLLAMKKKYTPVDIRVSDGGVLMLEHTEQFHYAIQKYGYLLVHFCVPFTRGCEYMTDKLEEASAILQAEGLHENFAFIHWEVLAPYVRRRFGVHHYPLMVQFHNGRVIGYYHDEAEECDDHEHCIWDATKIANFAREKVRVHESDEL